MNNQSEKKEKQPTHIIVLKTLFCVSCIFAVAGFVLLALFAKTVDSPVTSAVLPAISVVSLVGAVLLIPYAFEPEITKMRMKKEKYIQEQTENLQEDIASREGDIRYRANKKKARAFREGINLENCPFCGEELFGDEQFCDKCGHALYIKCKNCKSINAGNSKFCKKCGKEL